ncbi:hypothetical protein C9439_01945 [archaeon SCG-AAA382B04]|nr:hypothetical protein C9439_01945 [archaeon SCG-AAA382B04]
MKTSFKIFEIWEIPIKLHLSFLVILPIFAWVFANTEYFFASLESRYLAYGLGGLLAILFFLCILLHELGHSYVALKSGIDISSITLMIFGGVSSMDKPKEDSSIEMKLALAGPLVSVVIGLVLIGTSFLLGLKLPPFRGSELIIDVFIGWLGFINFVLAGFNLLPAFPMDGGRVLRAFLAKRMPYIEATEKAAGIGKAFAFGLGLLGFLSIGQGGFWFILIASFIYFGASEEEKATKISGALANKVVSDLMTEEVISVDPEMSLSEVVQIIRKKKHMGYPVLEQGELVGLITFKDIQDVPEKERDKTNVKEVMTKDLITVTPSYDAYEALTKMSKNGVGRLPVIKDTQLTGILSRSDFTTAIQLGSLWGE